MDVFILPHPSTQNLVEDHQQEHAHWGHGPASVHNQRHCSKLTPMQDNRGEGRGIWPGQKLRRCPGARGKVRRPGKEILAQETRHDRQGGTKDRDYVASKRAGKGRSQPQRNQDQRKTAKDRKDRQEGCRKASQMGRREGQKKSCRKDQRTGRRKDRRKSCKKETGASTRKGLPIQQPPMTSESTNRLKGNKY